MLGRCRPRYADSSHNRLHGKNLRDSATNGLENFWSCLKCTIGGTYVSVEPFHLFRYLEEQSFTFNNRKTNDANRFNLTSQSAGKCLTYAEVTGKDKDAREKPC